MFYYIVSDKNGEMYQRSYSVINRSRSLVDDQQLVKCINIFQPGSRLVRQFIFNDRTVLSTVAVHWWMISNWSNVSIYFSLVVDW
jgi:hypothetical protein